MQSHFTTFEGSNAVDGGIVRPVDTIPTLADHGCLEAATVREVERPSLSLFQQPVEVR